MATKMKIVSSLLVMSMILGACGQADNTSGNKSNNTEEKAQKDTEKKEAKSKEEAEEVSYAETFEEAVTELAKAKEGQQVDYEKVISIYNENLQALVQKIDGESESTIDQQLTTVLNAGKDGSLDGVVVKQIFDKLMQKVFYNTIKHEFNEVAENWGNEEEVNEEIEEAKEFYAILKTTVEKRDSAYSTTLVDKIQGGFDEMEQAVENDDRLAFQLGKQVIDKTLMKTFYLATGAVPHGYATKAAKEAKEDEKAAKAEQAEGWAFYQSIAGYIGRHAEEEGAFIEEQFNLESDVKNLDPQAINNAFVRGFSKVALDEYGESIENIGEDKGVITALEGALFIDMIDSDLKRILGEEAYSTLSENAASYLEAVKAEEKEKAEEILNNIKSTLDQAITEAK